MKELSKTELLELYKIFVDTSLKASENRLKINTFFITLNTAIIGSSGFINSELILIFGCCINAVWFNLLSSCKQLNTAKFKVICQMEKELCYKCFAKEQEEYKKYNRKPFAHLEQELPILISIVYVIMLLIMCVKKICGC